MPITVTFWRLPEEEKAFVEFLEKDPRVVAFRAENRSPISELPLESPSQILRYDDRLVFLALKPHVDQIRCVEYDRDGESRFGIDATNSPVITYKRNGYREPGKLGQSVIAAYLEAVTTNKEELYSKPDEFAKWAKSVASWVRRNTPEWHQYKTYRMTKKVSDSLKNGLELVP